MSDCRYGVSPVNYPDPDPDPVAHVTVFMFFSTVYQSCKVMEEII